METYSDFNELFNAQSNVKSDVTVFNYIDRTDGFDIGDSSDGMIIYHVYGALSDVKPIESSDWEYIPVVDVRGPFGTQEWSIGKVLSVIRKIAGRDIGRVFGSVVAISDKLSASEYRQFVERLASELDKQVDG